MIVKLLNFENGIVCFNFQRESGEKSNITLKTCILIELDKNKKISYAYDILKQKAFNYFNAIWETRNAPCNEETNKIFENAIDPKEEELIFEGWNYEQYDIEPKNEVITVVVDQDKLNMAIAIAELSKEIEELKNIVGGIKND